MRSSSPTEEVMAAGPAVTVSNLPGLTRNTSSSSPNGQQVPLRSTLKSSKGEDSYSLSHSNSKSHVSNIHSPSSQQPMQKEEKGNSFQGEAKEPKHNHHHKFFSRRRQESFDLNGWPEGIEKPTRFLGMRVKPVSQWSIKHIFCLSY